MPATKQQTEAALKVYETYWDSYTKGDLGSFVASLDETYEMIGTSENEICHTKADGIEFLKGQIAEVAGKAELRNRQIKIVPLEQLILVNEHSEIYVRPDSTWNFYSKIRISTLLRETEGGWKVVQQHGSLPDMRVQEGETMAIDKISRENLELRDAVDRRTAELEHKNWELEIEAALERVRTIAMGMQKPDDLLDVCRIISEQLEILNVTNIRNVQVAIIDEPKKIYANYQYFSAYANSVFEEIGYENNPASRAMVEEMQKSANSFFIGSIKDDELQQFREWRKKYDQFPDPVLDDLTEVFYYFYSIGQGGLGLTTYKAIGDKELNLFKRFHLVFNLAYRRFMDIQKAETQAREAQIEAALERTRTQSMLMQQSDEIMNISALFHQQLLQLNIPTEFSYVWLPDEQKNDHQFWASWEEDELDNKTMISKQVTYPLDKSEPYTAACYAAWASPEPTHIQFIPPADVPAFFDVWQELLDGAKKLKARFFPQGIYYAEAYMKYGCFGINIRRELSQGEKEVLKKFSIEFERAYTRFLDLQKAEAQAKEARLELSLERIRAQVTAMKESSELLDIVVTMRTEFVALNHEAHYFWYMRWLPEKYEKAMTSGDGTRIGMVMSLPRHIHGDVKLVADWEKSDAPTLVFAMDEETAVDYVHKMITLGDFEHVDPQAPTLDDIRQLGGLTFIMARTTHGEIGFSLPGKIHHPSKDAMNTLARFAGVFDLAYKRFEDLKTAEKDLIEIKAAKQRAEEALTELKATQTQLIQQEKLASLGQLTAGIAHEIKNPLNFVNNFSEVSMELIEEALEEISQIKENAHANESTEILADIKSNLAKIHEHGTRADSIVKSMLMHSRGGSGNLVLTDLNVLIREYVNLAFHGMRAGKNPINVDIQLDLDEKLGKVNLISEDFSRVVLNLVNNAFDAMREKVKIMPGPDLPGFRNLPGQIEYQPKLTIRTKAESGKVIIEIEDNGPGIPDDIKDKILQPFFTTKKGTEGTGLGLSITNDIVKAHGGTIKVETKENQGLPAGQSETAFIISIPVSKTA